MKRFIFAFAGLLVAFPLLAQDFKPRATWPFLYENFQPGASRSLDGTLTSDALFNVAVEDGALMYIGKDETIMRADMSRVYTVRIGDDSFVNAMGRLYKVLSEQEDGSVVLGTTLDVDELNKVNIGYGISSSTASAQSMANTLAGRFDIGGTKVAQSEQDKLSGKVLPVKETFYFRIGMQLIPATKSELINTLGLDKKAANAFFKQEKVKWRDPASLEKVLSFVAQQLKQN